ncbi:putative ribonuclease H protein [Sesamum angolense]|uniref:Ribonuclease H protein n=1 Tax=Sesamum angolense TaxID=2727404 RepID=A0AAE1W2N1_9LAMI|nr:putative ribonuclease H protein [Sesamum angolense]
MWNTRICRNVAIFEGAPFKVNRIISRTLNYLHLLGKANLIRASHWKGDRPVVSLLKIPLPPHKISSRISIVKWIKPDRGWFKLNTNGASKGNPGVAGAGGIIRNHLGQTVLAFQKHLGLTSNTAPELKAIYRGVKLCIDNNIRKIWVEIDANVALKLISSSSQGPWHLQNLLQQIRNLLSQTEFKISHIFREGNQVANYFANQAYFNQHRTILSPDNITSIPKDLIRLDACSFPAIRIRSISNSNFS